MIDWKLTAAKSRFLDTRLVQDRAKRGRLRVLGRFIGRVRLRAKHSIRKRKGSAPAGQPPYSHTHLLRDHIFYFLDKEQETAVAGPIRLNKGTDAPELLEYGGEVTRLVKGKSVLFRYRGNPSMHPALEAELPRLLPDFKDSIAVS